MAHADAPRLAGQENGDVAVAFEDVTVQRGGLTILEHVSAVVPRGGCTTIIGPNGAGKTTMLLALLGEMPFKGRIHRYGSAASSPRIGYIPQRLAFDRGMPITVTEFLALGFQQRPLWAGTLKDLRRRAIQGLADVKAAHLAAQRLGALSGGEIQRVLLALALMQRPELLVLDEPAAGVDALGEQIFCELLDRLRKERGFTQLMVSHDLATVTHHATHVICLNRTIAAQGPPQKALTHATLTAIFGMHMGLLDSRSMPNGQTVCTAACCQDHSDA